jgi:hypothetical protein
MSSIPNGGGPGEVQVCQVCNQAPPARICERLRITVTTPFSLLVLKLPSVVRMKHALIWLDLGVAQAGDQTKGVDDRGFCARDGHHKTEKLSDKTEGTHDQLCLGIPFSNLWQLPQLIDGNA